MCCGSNRVRFFSSSSPCVPVVGVFVFKCWAMTLPGILARPPVGLRACWCQGVSVMLWSWHRVRRSCAVVVLLRYPFPNVYSKNISKFISEKTDLCC